jgi:hypothetical protein
MQRSTKGYSRLARMPPRHDVILTGEQHRTIRKPGVGTMPTIYQRWEDESVPNLADEPPADYPVWMLLAVREVAKFCCYGTKKELRLALGSAFRSPWRFRCKLVWQTWP